MAPFKKKAQTVLAEAQQELIETNARLSDSGRRRDQLLLAGDESGLDVESELANLQKASVRGADRIRLLQEQAQQEEAADVLKRRADLVVRFEKKLAEADREADELQNLLAAAEKKFRKIIALRSDARAAWPVSDSHAAAAVGAAEGAALSGGAVAKLLQYELYRIGGRPYLGGSPGMVKEQDFPGGVTPSNELRGQPEKIKPFADALRQASKFAVDMMRGAAVLPATTSQPAVTTPDAPAPTPVMQPTPQPGNGGTPIKPPDQTNLAALLKRQHDLAMDPNASEAEYLQVVAAITALS